MKSRLNFALNLCEPKENDLSLFTFIYERRIASVLQDGAVNWIIFSGCENLWYGNYSTNILLMWNYYYFFYSFDMLDTIQVIIFVSWYYLLSIYYLPNSVTDTGWKGIPLWPCLLKIIILSKTIHIKKKTNTKTYW